MEGSHEICGNCGHDGWNHRHIKSERDECLGGLKRFDRCAAECREFVPSGRWICEGLVVGDYRSPNGGNRFASCETAARFEVTHIKDGSVNHFCGRHVRRCQKYVGQLYEITEVAR